ncbi:O-antigen ligase [uncultured Tessaracoccus sp.]|uniref:O-antigen ligase family protein n=1 Tax=uncultured Tessaracoccus sp. TaxID=905023 RepID=UPI00261DBA93|nr:hypothetical protein [uncultured Tessaracoccus sp.]
MNSEIRGGSDRFDDPLSFFIASLAVFLTARDYFVWFDFSISGLPTNTLAAVGLVAIASFRKPKWRLRLPFISATAVALFLWLVFTTVVIHGDWNIRRMGNILVLLLIGGAIASGRLGLKSLTVGGILGYLLALVTSVILMDESSYTGRLTGVLGDPNAAGFILVTLGLSFAQGLESRLRPWRWALFAVAVFGVWLTQSRTTMFALAIATLWILVSRFLPRWPAALALASTVWFYAWIYGVMEERGWFADRDGSDALRERLILAEQLQVQQAGWTGNGLGTAVAKLDNITLFFHNSYLAMQAEGGKIALYLLYAFIVALFLTIHRVPSKSRPVWVEAGVIAGFICSINIGFSITHPALAVAIGLYLYHYCKFREESQRDQLPSAYRKPELKAAPQPR